MASDSHDTVNVSLGATVVEYALALAVVGLMIFGVVMALNRSVSQKAQTSKSAIDGSRGMVACDPHRPLLNMDAGSEECY